MDIKSGTIVVGVDDSESSKRALTWAVEQAVAEHRALTLVHTIDAVTLAYMDAQWHIPRAARGAAAHRGRAGPGPAARRGAGCPGPRGARGAPLRGPARGAPRAVAARRPRGGGFARSRQAPEAPARALSAWRSCVTPRAPWSSTARTRGLVRNGIVVGADASEDSRAVLEFAYRQASLRSLPLTVLHCFWDVQAATASSTVVTTRPRPGDGADAALGVDGGA